MDAAEASAAGLLGWCAAKDVSLAITDLRAAGGVDAPL